MERAHATGTDSNVTFAHGATVLHVTLSGATAAASLVEHGSAAAGDLGLEDGDFHLVVCRVS